MPPINNWHLFVLTGVLFTTTKIVAKILRCLAASEWPDIKSQGTTKQRGGANSPNQPIRKRAPGEHQSPSGCLVEYSSKFKVHSRSDSCSWRKVFGCTWEACICVCALPHVCVYVFKVEKNALSSLSYCLFWPCLCIPLVCAEARIYINFCLSSQWMHSDHLVQLNKLQCEAEQCFVLFSAFFFFYSRGLNNWRGKQTKPTGVW